MNKWDKREYRRIKSATIQNTNVVVRFEDETQVTIPTDLLRPSGRPNVIWNEIQVEPHEIQFGTGGQEFAVPWSKIRSLTDPEYRSFVEVNSKISAQRAGRGIRVLREERDLSSKEVATRAGISAQSLSRIENGRHDVVFTTLQRILNAMGCSLRDLADATSHAQKEVEVWTKQPPGSSRVWESGNRNTPDQSQTPGRNTPNRANAA